MYKYFNNNEDLKNNIENYVKNFIQTMVEMKMTSKK